MNEPAVFLTQSDVRSLLAAPEAGSLTLPQLGLLAAQPRMQRLQVVADHASFASFCRIDSFDERVRTAVTAALDSSVEVSTVVLGHGIADAAAIHPLDGNSQPLFDQVITELADLIFELRRRDNSHFERVPLTLPAPNAGSLHMLTATSVATFLSARADRSRGRSGRCTHLQCARRSASRRALRPGGTHTSARQ